jgi:hypothetical protein
VGNLRQIGDPDQSVPACERQGLVAALGLGDAENPVRSRVVDVIVPWSSITSRRASGNTAYRKLFCAPTAPGMPNPAGHQSAERFVDR